MGTSFEAGFALAFEARVIYTLLSIKVIGLKVSVV